MNTFVRFLLPSVGVGLLVAALIIGLMKIGVIDSGGIVIFENAKPTSDTSYAPRVSFADAVERAQPAVVNIYTSKIITRSAHPLYDDPIFRRFFGLNQAPQRRRMQSSLGSGVIMSEAGYVLTNNHVIEGADEIRVALHDGRELLASVVGTDPETDLAVLSIESRDLPSITMASSREVRVGDVVLAIGNPFGVGQTVTEGIVSALGRNQSNISNFVDFIQTDAAINPGNSGGALVNAHGDLIGINTAIYSQTGASNGIGFAIPIDLAKTILMAIVKDGQVVRGWLGIEPQIMTAALAELMHVEFTPGLLVAGVFRDGPAFRAGVRPGDIITQINGTEVTAPRTAMNMISSLKPGEHVKLQAQRSNQTVQFSATVEARPDPN
ncbi:HtrA-like protease AlgW [gamma proteobacterium HdN1]|nr:HtrA-like protease AlgW [gamma proteobacterium HdN1]